MVERINIPKTTAGQFVKTMKEYNEESNPLCMRENFFIFGSISLIRTNNIITIIIANRYTKTLYPMLTVNVALEITVKSLYDNLRLLK